MKRAFGLFLASSLAAGMLFFHRHSIWQWLERLRLRWEGEASLCVPLSAQAHGCIDYNGPWGNYSPEAHGWQRAVNFLGSDCCMALLEGYCWDEFITHVPCIQNHGGKTCSELIGHYTDSPTTHISQRHPAK